MEDCFFAWHVIATYALDLASAAFRKQPFHFLISDDFRWLLLLRLACYVFPVCLDRLGARFCTIIMIPMHGFNISPVFWC